MSEEAQGVEAEAVEAAPVAAEAKTETPSDDATPAKEVKSNEADNGDAESGEPEAVQKTEREVELEKKVARQRAALRKSNETEQRARELEARIAELTKGDSDENEPNIDDFDSPEDYYTAKGEYNAKTKYKEQEKQRLEQQKYMAEQKRREDAAAKVTAQEAEFRAEVADYDEAVEEMNDYITGQDISPDSASFQAFREAILSSETAPAVMYELGKNAELREELMGLPPIQVARKIFEIEYGVKRGGKPVASKPSPKPTPPKPVAGTGKSSKSLAKSSGEDVMRWVNS